MRGRAVGEVRQDNEAAVLPEVGIEGDGLPDSKSFHEREARRVSQAEILIAILEDDVDRAPFVLGGGSFNAHSQLGEISVPGTGEWSGGGHEAGVTFTAQNLYSGILP